MFWINEDFFIMTNLSRFLIGTAGLAATLAVASPAAAQQPYPYNNQSTGVLGAIVNAVTGNSYNQYPQGVYGYNQYPQVAYGYNQYPQVAYSYGQYPQGNYGYGQTNQRAAVGMCAAAAEQRISATYSGQPGYSYNSGYQSYANGYNGQAYSNGYNGQNPYANQAADLRFTCKVNTLGQVTDLNINRNQVAYR